MRGLDATTFAFRRAADDILNIRAIQIDGEAVPLPMDIAEAFHLLVALRRRGPVGLRGAPAGLSGQVASPRPFGPA